MGETALQQPTPPAIHAGLTTDGRVCTTVFCVQCQYDLRTLAVDAVCPECRRPVVESLSGPPLRFASAAWLRRLRLVLALLGWGSALILIGPVLSILMLLVVATGVLSRLLSFPGVWALPVLAVVGMVAGLGLSAAAFILQQLAPPKADRDLDKPKLRRRLRVALFLLVGTLILAGEAAFLLGERPQLLKSVLLGLWGLAVVPWQPASALIAEEMRSAGFLRYFKSFLQTRTYFRFITIGAIVSAVMLKGAWGAPTWPGPLIPTMANFICGSVVLAALVAVGNLATYSLKARILLATFAREAVAREAADGPTPTNASPTTDGSQYAVD